MKLYLSEPELRESGPILVHDEDHNDIAEFYHNEHATVGQSYRTALLLAKALVAQCNAGHLHFGGQTEAEPDRPYCKHDQTCCDFCCGN